MVGRVSYAVDFTCIIDLCYYELLSLVYCFCQRLPDLLPVMRVTAYVFAINPKGLFRLAWIKG